MTSIVLTGAPGAGKTTLALRLESRGFRVVHEAFMDLYARLERSGVSDPLQHPRFIEMLTELQLRRQGSALAISGTEKRVQIFDRSPLCTLALCHYAGAAVPERLLRGIERFVSHPDVCRSVLFIESLDFSRNEGPRRLSLAEALSFGRIHRSVYESHGFCCIEIPAMPIEPRLDRVLETIEKHAVSLEGYSA